MSVLRALGFAISGKHLPESVMKVLRCFPAESKPSTDPWIWESPRTVELGGPLVARKREHEQPSKNIGVSNMVKPDDVRWGGLANDAQIGFR